MGTEIEAGPMSRTVVYENGGRFGRFGGDDGMAGFVESIAAKDATIAELKSRLQSIDHVSDLANRTFARDREIEGRVSTLEATQKAEAAATAEYRRAQEEIARLRECNLRQEIKTVAAKAADGLIGLNHEIGRLGRVVDEVTGVYVHAGKVTPLPMRRYNKWEIPLTAGADETDND